MQTYHNIKNVLIADDDIDLRNALQEIVQNLGFACSTAENGEDAFHQLQNGRFDLLITDFRMPVLDGVGLLKKCRENGIHIPVIFNSSDADLVRTEQVALSDCCATLMYKPLNLNVLKAALGAADQRSHHLDCIHLRKGPVS